MALVVEDGTARADAESYISVADASAYHAARGNVAWAGLASDTLREHALRAATAYMALYRGRWAGWRKTAEQALDWPRNDVPVPDGPGGVYPTDSVPVAVRNACAELALKSLSGPLAPDLKPPKLRVKVGPIETEYARGDRQTTVYQSVEALLRPFLGSSANAAKVVRT